MAETTTKKTQTVDQAVAAVIAAGHKVQGHGVHAKIYDPDIYRAFLTIDPGYCDAEFSAYCQILCKSVKKGGPSGAFKNEIRAILKADRESR